MTVFYTSLHLQWKSDELHEGLEVRLIVGQYHISGFWSIESKVNPVRRDDPGETTAECEIKAVSAINNPRAVILQRWPRSPD